MSQMHVKQSREKSFPGLFTYYLKLIESRHQTKNTNHFAKQFYPISKSSPKISHLKSKSSWHRDSEGVFSVRSLSTFTNKKTKRLNYKKQQTEYREYTEYTEQNIKNSNSKQSLKNKQQQTSQDLQNIQFSRQMINRTYTSIHASKSNRFMKKSDLLLSCIPTQKRYSKQKRQHMLKSQDTSMFLKIKSYKKEHLPLKYNFQPSESKQKTDRIQQFTVNKELVKMNTKIQQKAIQKFIRYNKKNVNKTSNLLKYKD